MTSLLVKSVCLLLVVVSASVDFAMGHGRMIEPAARNTMWRFNYKNPRNYNDMGLNCGGFPNQFERQNGRCGSCGDPFQGPRPNEAGGKYARGVIARQYQPGTFINITVELTSNHGGYMEFRLCPVNNPLVRASKSCLDSNLLNIVGHGTRYFITENGAGIYIELLVMLPPKLECSQCVLQWKWVAGQSMGPDGFGGECMGCGNQEHFINCADIAIGNKAVKPLPPLKGTAGSAAKASPSVPKHGPAYDVVSNSAGYSASYGTKSVAPAVHSYSPPVHAAPKPQTTTLSPWKMDTNMLFQKLMEGGAFGQSGFMMETPSPWGPPWQQQQQQQQQQPQQQQYQQQPQQQQYQQQPQQQQYQQQQHEQQYQQQQQYQQDPLPQAEVHQSAALSSMYGTMPNFYRENTEWSTEAPRYEHRANYVTPAPEGHDPSDYAGNEPGEYPENESNQGAASGGNGGGSTYMQGYNDALRQMQQQLGVSGGWNPKASRAASEVTLSINEKQKQQGSKSSCPGKTCKATGSWKGQVKMDTWCETTCKAGQCPSHMCACSCPGSGGWGRTM